MSPLSLRRYRAERLLRDEFEALRGRVLATVRGRLGAGGSSLDQGDLEACYAVAWQGLYAAVLDGQEIANPTGWLVLVTFRRAIEDLRARGRSNGGTPWSQGAGVGAQWEEGEPGMDAAGTTDLDLAAELDHRMQLRQLFEGLRGRLDGREREAATLCYLQGLSRSEAAARMNVSDARMRKLMEGRGPGRPGVASKVGALVQAIRDGDWCEQQGSLMRALAFGVLDPQGERYQLALLHHAQCPACRAYVVSLRGLAAALPPVFLPCSLGAAVLGLADGAAHAGSGAGVAGTGSSAPGGAAGAGLQAGRGVAGAASASGAAGVGGAAGGGWLIGAGPFGAKLAVGCLLALGVGAGCVALDDGGRAHVPRHWHRLAARAHGPALPTVPGGDELAGFGLGSATSSAAGAGAAALTPATKAIREFGPEALVAGAGGSSTAVAHSQAARLTKARSASAGSGQVAASSPGSRDSASAGSQSAGSSSSSASDGDSTAAEREFSPG
ncbi:MAG TPA: sigma-70 family RNA polymerase sigma factor [Solirubrobacteraceae bacterium]|nr:sigma-70 family RNA polymerase sigma factor [Solirubrobacteraceae bacterium]